MVLVSNTSPLSNLAVIGRLELVKEQFGAVIVPNVVWTELQALEHPGGREALMNAHRSGWLEVQIVENRPLVIALRRRLDGGEAEAIALALSIPGSTLLIDERDGRQEAAGQGIVLIGALGILIRARQSGRISSLRAEIGRLRSEAHFFIAPMLERTVLKRVGESENAAES